MSVLEISPEVETCTSIDESGSPIELLLVGIDAQLIGSQNSFNPPDFDREHLTTWLKKRYFFMDGRVYAQVPRKMDEYPAPVTEQFGGESSFATNILSYEFKTHVYYPTGGSEAIRLTWDAAVNHWSMATVEQPGSEQRIDSDAGDAANFVEEWESRSVIS